jgi:fatty-acyl-CoA synthase
VSTIPISRTIPRLLSELADMHADRDALVGGGWRLTYAELAIEVTQLARRLHSLGVGRGDKVAILMGNKPEWVTSALAIASLGGIMVALNTWATTRELEYLIRHSDTKYLIASPNFLKYDYQKTLQELEPLSSRFPMLKGVLGVGDDLPSSWLPLIDHQAGSAANDEMLEHCFDRVQPTDIAFLLYTSGSTSTPKGVQLQHFALIENPFQIGERQHVTGHDRVWLSVSLFWGLGCVNAMMNMLTHGACLVLQEYFDAGEALRLIEQEKCTLFYGTPNMAQALHEHQDRPSRDLTSMRGGMAMGSHEQIMRVVELGASEICNVYGMSETYGNSHITDAADPLRLRLKSCGRPLPGVIQKIVSADGVEQAPGEVGEIRLKGYVTAGYYKDEALFAQCFDESGYFKTGDLGYVDEEGYLYFQGRLKEMVKTGGINVAPAEVESVLMAHAGVQLAQVVGVPDDSRDEILAAVIVQKNSANLSVDEIIRHCKENLAAYKVPRLVCFIMENELPLTTTGKIQKNRIAATFFGGRGV